MRRIPELCKYRCEIEAAFAIIGGKWKARIIWHIGNGCPRFNELKDILENVSPRMLAKQLRELERDGLVVRTMYQEIPPRVEYHLTQAGLDLLPVLNQICEWTMSHYPEHIPPGFVKKCYE